jgi:hypothetical protein
MNADFSIPLTPAIARRLIAAVGLGGLDVDHAIREAAERDFLPPSRLPATPAQFHLFQFIHDCGFRCVVPSWTPEMSEWAVLASLTYPDVPRPITVACKVPGAWLAASKNLGLDVAVMSHAEAAGHQFQKEARKGVLVMVWESLDRKTLGDELHRALAMEFERTIIWGDARTDFTGRHELYGRSDRPESGMRKMVQCLWPLLPTRYLTGLPGTQLELRAQGYVRQRTHDIAPLYGVFTPPVEILPP